jgi:transposase
VRDYVDSTEGEIVIETLPAYAPELNPVEYLWAWLKRHALANFCPETLDELHCAPEPSSSPRSAAPPSSRHAGCRPSSCDVT